MGLLPSLDEQAYVKQMRNVDSNYLPLYNPNPWSEDYVYLGDVGVIQSGTFRPLFNITRKATQSRNGWGVPENFETLPFSPSSDTYTNNDPTVIKKFDPCIGDSRVTWSRGDEAVENGMQDIPEVDEEQHEKEYPRFSYKLKKTSPEASYVLLSMSDVEETMVEEAQMEVWRHYIEKHHKYWVKYIRKKWQDPNFKADSLVLLCGVVKSSNWVIATLPREGEYQLDIQDSPVGIQPTLTLEGKRIEKGLRYGQDTVQGDREIMQHFAKLAGLRVPDSSEPIRKRCLFLRGLRMEKDFWLPKHVVAAAEPRDPHPGSDDGFKPSPLLALSPNQRRDWTCKDHPFPCRCRSETVQRPPQPNQIEVATYAPTHPSLSLAPIGYAPRRFHCSSSAPAVSLSTMTSMVAC